MGVSRTGGSNPPDRRKYLPGVRDEDTYNSYVAFCGIVGVTPMSFEDWFVGASGIPSPIMAREQRRFHQTEDRSLATEDYRGYSEPPRREWNGAWDNAVATLER